jgi:hypothetical protein
LQGSDEVRKKLEKFWFKEKKKIKKNGQLLLDWLLSVVLSADPWAWICIWYLREIFYVHSPPPVAAYRENTGNI